MYMGAGPGMEEQIVQLYGKFQHKYDAHLSFYAFVIISKHTIIQ